MPCAPWRSLILVLVSWPLAAQDRGLEFSLGTQHGPAEGHFPKTAFRTLGIHYFSEKAQQNGLDTAFVVGASIPSGAATYDIPRSPDGFDRGSYSPGSAFCIGGRLLTPGAVRIAFGLDARAHTFKREYSAGGMAGETSINLQCWGVVQVTMSVQNRWRIGLKAGRALGGTQLLSSADDINLHPNREFLFTTALRL